MTRRLLSAALTAALFAAGTPLLQADTVSQTDESTTVSAPDLIPGFGLYLGYTYTYQLGTGLSGTLNSLKLKFDGRPGNGWAVEIFCKTSAVFTGGDCPTSFGNAGSLAPASTVGGTTEYTAQWSGTPTFESDKFYFFQLRVDQNVDQSTPATLSGSGNAGSYSGSCEQSQSTDGFCAAVTDPYFVLDFTPPAPADTTPPTITIDFGPAEGARVASSTPYFGFSSDDAGAFYECAWDGAATSTCSSPSSAALADGSHSFAVIATDVANNSTTAVRTFTIDTAAPALADMPANQIVEAAGASTTVSYTPPTATDAIEGAVAVSCSPLSGWGFSLGSTTVTCSAQDSLGNGTSALFVVSVVDTTVPVVTLSGAATINLAVGDTFSDPGAGATDLGATISVSASGSVDTSTAGTYILTYSATDTSGNTGSTTRTVTVSAPPPPPPPPSGGGNGPPAQNPSQGLPQGLILGVTNNAVENASEQAKGVIESILPPAKLTVPGTPKQTGGGEVRGAQEKKEAKAEKKAEHASVTPWDLPAGVENSSLSAAAANAGTDFPLWWLLLGVIAALLIALLGFVYRSAKK